MLTLLALALIPSPRATLRTRGARMGLEEAWKTEAAAARAAFAAREQSRTRKKGSVAQLDASNFASSLAAVERVGVVKFFSPQCPACRRLAPVYEAAAKRFSGQADFFEVNYKQAQQVCREERVLLLPMVHLYVPRAGCVDRFVLSYKRRKRLEEKLDGLLAGEGERLDRLRELDPAALAPLVRLKELLGAVQAVRRAPELLRGAAGDGWVTEQQTEEMQSVFRALDRNGDGVLDAEELAAACEALGMPFSSEEELRRVVTAADGDASTDTVVATPFLDGARAELPSGGWSVELGGRARVFAADGAARERGEAPRPPSRDSSRTSAGPSPGARARR